MLPSHLEPKTNLGLHKPIKLSTVTHVCEGRQLARSFDVHMTGLLYENVQHFRSVFLYSCEAGSSVSIVTGYGLGNRDSIPDRGRGFFL
jgi:hypothetical protein